MVVTGFSLVVAMFAHVPPDWQGKEGRAVFLSIEKRRECGERFALDYSLAGKVRGRCGGLELLFRSAVVETIAERNVSNARKCKSPR